MTLRPCLHPNLSLYPLPLSPARRAYPLPLPTTPPSLAPGQARCRAASAPTIRPFSLSLLHPTRSRPYIPMVYSHLPLPPLCRSCDLHVGTLSALPRVHQDSGAAQLATLPSLWTTVNFQKSLSAICNSRPSRFAESVCRSVSNRPKSYHACSSGI